MCGSWLWWGCLVVVWCVLLIILGGFLWLCRWCLVVSGFSVCVVCGYWVG